MKEVINEILLRELDKLEKEIESFPEDKLWSVSGNVINSAGNLCQHLCGNLQHFIGAVLGETGYVRDRDVEFSSKNNSKEKLIQEIQSAKKTVSNTLSKLADGDLKKIYAQKFMEKNITTEFLLIHLVAHFNYHLGQINYLRRLIA